MCTVTWCETPEGRALWFNRDERRTRSGAFPPERRVSEDSDIDFLAPLDPDGGGTWIFVNNRGLVCALLNNYAPRPPASRPPTSRGRLMLALAGCADLPSLETALRRHLDTDAYAPCFLLALPPGGQAVLWEWNGPARLRRGTPALPVHTTSSFHPEKVVSARLERYRNTVADPSKPTLEELEAFHRQHDPENPADSVRMARPDARTVSTTRVDLDTGRARMLYCPATGGRYGTELALSPSLP